MELESSQLDILTYRASYLASYRSKVTVPTRSSQLMAVGRSVGSMRVNRGISDAASYRASERASVAVAKLLFRSGVAWTS